MLPHSRSVDHSAGRTTPRRRIDQPETHHRPPARRGFKNPPSPGAGFLNGRVLGRAQVGFMGWALFVVGHDCGHGTYSTSKALNFIVGHVAHTPLLVPFTGWQVRFLRDATSSWVTLRALWVTLRACWVVFTAVLAP
jgi:hypothetical protein